MYRQNTNSKKNFVLVKYWATTKCQNSFSVSSHTFYKSLELCQCVKHHASKNVPLFGVLMMVVENSIKHAVPKSPIGAQLG